ncbi:hypothetical protein HOF92_01955 [bacterium]|jgi:hypothetical protein|nr:hypothetical protein [bacterium]
MLTVLRNTYLFFYLFSALSFAYTVVPEEGEKLASAHNRVFEAFTEEFRSLKLDPTSVVRLRNSAPKASAQVREKLSKARWPSYYDTVFRAQELWQSGPRPQRVSLENLRIIYSHFLHYSFYLQYSESRGPAGEKFRQVIRKISKRAREGMVLDSLRNQDGEPIPVKQILQEEVLKQYVLEEVVQYLVFCMETVVGLGWEILERNWHPESFWSDGLKKIGGKIIFESSDADSLSALKHTNSYPAPILLLGDTGLGIPDLRVHLTEEERAFFLENFLTLNLPLSTSKFVSRLNRKFNYREKLRLRRRTYLEKKSFEEKAFNPGETEFLNPEDLK